ncbi:MAG: hypothetical protein ACREXS_20005 [Gammaproteobacteria bacterium]
MTAPFIIEPLGPSHDRTHFSSDVEALDRYFRERVAQDVRRRVTACYVAIELTASKIAGYYTLTLQKIRLFGGSRSFQSRQVMQQLLLDRLIG